MNCLMYALFLDSNGITYNFNRLIFCVIGIYFHFSWEKIWYVEEKM